MDAEDNGGQWGSCTVLAGTIRLFSEGQPDIGLALLGACAITFATATIPHATFHLRRKYLVNTRTQKNAPPQEIFWDFPPSTLLLSLHNRNTALDNEWRGRVSVSTFTTAVLEQLFNTLYKCRLDGNHRRAADLFFRLDKY